MLGNKHVKNLGSSPDGITVTVDMKHFPEGLGTTDMNSSHFWWLARPVQSMK